MNKDETLIVARQVLEYVKRLQNDMEIPEIPEHFADDIAFLSYHKKIVELRNVLAALAKGNLSVPVTSRGFIAGACKSLQSKLRHMLWMANQVETEDYDQRIDFLGDLSASFNNMAIRLKETTEVLLQKEESLIELAASLQMEAKGHSESFQELKKSEQRFKHLANHDPLTGLLNRRSFFSLAEVTLESAVSLNKSCCVCLLDVDDFKKFNDTFGHLEGDRALQHVVKQSLNVLRNADIVGRYGGEEFVFLLPNMEETHGYTVAERIRLAIEKNVFLLESSHTISLTVSIGVVIITPDDKTDDYATKLRTGISQADTALYEAKSYGKNQVRIFVEAC